MVIRNGLKLTVSILLTFCLANHSNFHRILLLVSICPVLLTSLLNVESSILHHFTSWVCTFVLHPLPLSWLSLVDYWASPALSKKSVEHAHGLLFTFEFLLWLMLIASSLQADKPLLKLDMQMQARFSVACFNRSIFGMQSEFSLSNI